MECARSLLPTAARGHDSCRPLGGPFPAAKSPPAAGRSDGPHNTQTLSAFLMFYSVYGFPLSDGWRASEVRWSNSFSILGSVFSGRLGAHDGSSRLLAAGPVVGASDLLRTRNSKLRDGLLVHV